MKVQRTLTLLFAAALTAGTSSATSFITVFVGPAGGGSSQSVSLLIDGSQIGQYSGAGSGSAIITIPTDTYTDGWHSITINYDSISGPNGLTMFLNGGWAAAADLGSLDSSGSLTNGLRGDFSTTTGSLVKTVYGGNDGTFIHYSGGTAPWSGTFNGGTFGTTTAFEEQLSGWIYFGAGTPSLSDIPGQQQPDGGGGAAPEPASWWLMAAALPLMLFSKLRLIRARQV